MSHDIAQNLRLPEAVKNWLHPKCLLLLLLGFSAGLPILLIFSTLSVWLREAGVERSAVTFFSWAALGYSFKFIWAPIIDLLPVPYISGKLGRRRAWLLVSQLSIVVAIVLMGSINPQQESLALMALAAVFLGFSSATQDIVIDAYRIESAKESMQALLASMYIAGYRVGMLVAGAGSLFIASSFGTTSELYQYTAWQKTYYCMALTMVVGILATLFSQEPLRQETENSYKPIDYLRFCFLFLITVLCFVLCFFYGGVIVQKVQEMWALTGRGTSFVFQAVRLLLALGMAFSASRLLVACGLVDAQMVEKSYVAPVQDFFARFGAREAILILALVGCYRVSDIVLGVISNVFYLDMGFSKNIIAGVTKTFGLSMTLIGGFLGGVLTLRYGVYRILLLGAILAALTNLLFVVLVHQGGGVELLTVVIGADNLCAGLASTAFVAFLSSITNTSFTAVQYAIFSSIMTLLPKFLGGYSGSMVEAIGYENFFLVTAALGLPVIMLVVIVSKTFSQNHIDKDIK